MVAVVLYGACAVISAISSYEGQHQFYNCFVELKMSSSITQCGSDKCSGSVFLLDERNGQSVTIHVSGRACEIQDLGNNGIRFVHEISTEKFLLSEMVHIDIGEDGRLLSAESTLRKWHNGIVDMQRVECRGQNPVRRDLGRDR